MEIKISEELNSIINYSRQEAMRTGSYGIAPDHLFLGIIRHDKNTAADVLKALETDLMEMKGFLDGKIFTNEHIPYSEAEQITFSRGAQNVLSFTVIEANRLHCKVASSEHLLLALCRSHSGYGITYLRDTGVDYDRVYSYMEKCGIFDKAQSENNEAEPTDNENVENPAPKEISLLEKFGYDLTEAASSGKLDPVAGREEETDRIIRILCRRKKNNPMLVGEPGTGKSAIVEGIAMKIASGDIPPVLQGKKLISLDIASVVAGTKYRGDFEKRFKSILTELEKNEDIILFIDEFHTLVGAGGASGSLDAANIMKPSLARGGIQCIGATTNEEFRNIIEKDGALNRRFQKVPVDPTDTEQTIAILNKIKGNYESYHSVVYSPESIEACVKLSERYISDRCLPDKAVDVMDEAGSMTRLKKAGKKNIPVTADDIAVTISGMTGIPAGRIAESEGRKLLRLEKELRKNIIGQDEAISGICKAIIRNRAGLKDPNRPIGTFLFTGPTGVGKTHLAKSLAESLFDSSDSLVRIDMSEYMEKFNVSRLIGAPPGYVGYENGGQLSEKVRRKPYSVVLLDEIEKAHPDVFNLLLQVLDEGRLTDSNGRTINFRNTILIMTSNVGSRDVEAFGNSIGFSTPNTDHDKKCKTIIGKAIKQLFPPEFINRIDEQTLFNPLSHEDIEKIIDIEIRELKDRVKAVGYTLSVSPAAKRLIAEAGYDDRYGARPLKRAIRRFIEDPVSEYILTYPEYDRNENGTLKVVLDESKNKTKVIG